ncbi:MBL fold metallo-hydrolase [Xanthovirga aplysinae]|uniref:MBL fold metallo-hydrolase n=1 Tax=Xanthovirga aplysinae TaxID=2529853 RepID=UPI0012BD54C8|nr:MBL fold metallo-hydrolase [Xanthovirga aplysinae]MTI29751.1 MBL fold metallo-hydrolase [Xanthovirga aplysinae]
MKVKFLGTGTSQGVPVIACHCEVCESLDFRDKRLRSSVQIEVEGKSIIIDSGPDFRQQVIREGIEKLDALIYTHQHKDHTAGLDDVRGFNFKQNKDMPVYARKEVLDQLQQEFSYIFAENKYPGTPRLEVYEIQNSPFLIDQVEIIPIEVLHYKMPVFGFRIQDFTYITDANFISQIEKEKIRGSKVLVLNALQQKKHISHFNLEEALAVIEELAPQKAFLTHISHYLGLHAEISSKLPANVELAYDGLEIAID